MITNVISTKKVYLTSRYVHSTPKKPCIFSKSFTCEYRSSYYNIDDLNYELLGFKITASDIEIHVDPKKNRCTKTRIDIPLLLAKDIKVSDGGLINLSYKE